MVSVVDQLIEEFIVEHISSDLFPKADIARLAIVL
jgi:hypothetical protein